MSKGKELQYSVNRSFEKIKLPFLCEFRIAVENSQREISDILLTYPILIARTIAGRLCDDNILVDVSDRELLKVNFSIISYSNIEQKLG
jgi:hypothetical protein